MFVPHFIVGGEYARAENHAVPIPLSSVGGRVLVSDCVYHDGCDWRSLRPADGPVFRPRGLYQHRTIYLIFAVVFRRSVECGWVMGESRVQSNFRGLLAVLDRLTRGLRSGGISGRADVFLFSENLGPEILLAALEPFQRLVATAR